MGNRTARLACLAGLALVAGCRDEKEVSPKAEPAALRVTTIKPKLADLRRTTSQPGHIEAFEETPIFARVPGYVQAVRVDIGTVVKKGDVLLELATPELRDEARQREAELAKARALVLQATSARDAAIAKAKTAEAAIAEAKASVDRAEANYSRSKSEFDRIEQLAKSNAVTPKLVDEGRATFLASDAGRREAAARVASTVAAAAEARALVQKAEADLDVARSEVGIGESNLQLTKTMLDYSIIRAPFDGVVTSRKVHTGHFIAASAPNAAAPLLTLVRNHPVRVAIDVPEVDAPHVQPGDSVALVIPALPKDRLMGKVARIASSLNPNNRTMRVELDVTNNDGNMIPGMYVTAVIVVDERKNVLALPTSAIQRSPEGRESCFIVEGGKLKSQSVETGLFVNDQVEIISGIRADDDVVKAASHSFVDGSPAEAVPAPNEQSR